MTIVFLPTILLAAQLVNGSTGADDETPECIFLADEIRETPEGGRIECGDITIPPGVDIVFTQNKRNDPVLLLSTGRILIRGTISVSGQGPNNAAGGRGGPGGFAGGDAAQGLAPAGGPGHGPGGGTWQSNNSGAGGGAFGTRNTLDFGEVYGDPRLFPIIGGSGGAGSATTLGGGGGGGAILIAAAEEIEITGTGEIYADGADYSQGNAPGSGGAIRLVSKVVKVAAGPRLFARGGVTGNRGLGRIRIDAIDKSAAPSTISTLPPPTFGTNLVVEFDEMPKVELVSAAGFTPTNGQPFTRMLPPGSDLMQQVVFRATGFGSCQASIKVHVVPETGTTTITELPPSSAEIISGSVPIPSNVKVSIEAYGQAVACGP